MWKDRQGLRTHSLVCPQNHLKELKQKMKKILFGKIYDCGNYRIFRKSGVAGKGYRKERTLSSVLKEFEITDRLKIIVESVSKEEFLQGAYDKKEVERK